VHTRLFVGLVHIAAEPQCTRLGITTTKKIGTAVVRNRTRRLVREAFRRNRALFPEGVDLVVVAKRSAAESTARDVESAIVEIGRRAARIAEAERC
jgi:ribonuclease P protein component